jgi:Transposase IS66 family
LRRLGGARFKPCVSPPEDLDGLSPSQLKELVASLLEKVAELERANAEQREEIARLKGLKGRPDIKPSGMDKSTEPSRSGMQGKRPGRGKVRPRVVVEDRIIKASVPAGSRFKGYETYQIQELVLSVHAVRYLRERWVTPDGQTIVAPLPDGTEGHFGPNLRRFVLMQYHQGQSTLPRLAALLQSVGLAISEREIQRLLTEKQDDFLDETRDVLRAGLRTSPWISVDDTGARHKAKNGYCTHMWTAPSLQGLCSGVGQIACVHMSGLFGWRSRRNAGQDGFRDTSSKQIRRPYRGPLRATEWPASWID